KVSPEWLAAASASRSPDRSRPARSTPAACIDLLLERGKTGAVTSPSASSTAPSAPSRTRLPRCRPSTKPERTTSASTGGVGEGVDEGVDEEERGEGDGAGIGGGLPGAGRPAHREGPGSPGLPSPHTSRSST